LEIRFILVICSNGHGGGVLRTIPSDWGRVKIYRGNTSDPRSDVRSRLWVFFGFRIGSLTTNGRTSKGSALLIGNSAGRARYLSSGCIVRRFLWDTRSLAESNPQGGFFQPVTPRTREQPYTSLGGRAWETEVRSAVAADVYITSGQAGNSSGGGIICQLSSYPY
jgi:hypothetical protein